MKNRKKGLRLFCVIISLIFCAGCFTACKSQEEKADDTTGLNATITGWNIANGVSSFKIVHPNNPPQLVKTSLEALLSAFESKTGVRPETATDYKKKSEVYNSSSYEILLGRTDHEQTQEVLSSLGSGQFAIKLIGNKIVITAKKDSDLISAVEYFIENYINVMSVNNEVYSLKVTDYIGSTNQNDTLTVNGNSISEYKIIYATGSSGYLDIATRLSDTMKELGYNVSLGRDDAIPETDNAKEILIGKTNRTVSQRLYDEAPPKLMTYKLVVDGTYLQIISGGPFSARECINEMTFEFFGAEDKSFENGTYCETDMNSINSFSSGTDIRIMTANVLARRWATFYEDKNIPVIQRAEIFAATLIGSQPDVIGVQESDDYWINILPAYLDYIKSEYNIEYKWLFTDYLGIQTLTTVIYRSDKYIEVASGIENVGFWESTEYNLRLSEWVYLREKNNADHEFILCNTHWAYEDAEKIDASVQQSIDLVEHLKTTYKNVPIFYTGDYNSTHREDSDYITKFLPQTGCIDAMLTAVENGVRVNDCAGSGNLGDQRFEGYSYIDHIACYGSSIKILKYETLVGKNIYCTDHLPQIADIKLWQ